MPCQLWAKTFCRCSLGWWTVIWLLIRTDAISGVSVAGNIITIYQAIFIALGAAISSVISKSLGQKDKAKLAYHVTEALKITLLLSFLLGALSIFAGQEMIGLLGTEQTVAEKWWTLSIFGRWFDCSFGIND